MCLAEGSVLEESKEELLCVVCMFICSCVSSCFYSTLRKSSEATTQLCVYSALLLGLLLLPFLLLQHYWSMLDLTQELTDSGD